MLNGYYGLDGEQRNRGVELNIFGEPTLGLRLNGSVQWLDPEQTKTAKVSTMVKMPSAFLASTRC